jgi:hypothetical protein
LKTSASSWQERRDHYGGRGANCCLRKIILILDEIMERDGFKLFFASLQELCHFAEPEDASKPSRDFDFKGIPAQLTKDPATFRNPTDLPFL